MSSEKSRYTCALQVFSEETTQIGSNVTKTKVPKKASDVSPRDVRRMLSTVSGRATLQNNPELKVNFLDIGVFHHFFYIDKFLR